MDILRSGLDILRGMTKGYYQSDHIQWLYGDFPRGFLIDDDCSETVFYRMSNKNPQLLTSKGTEIGKVQKKNFEKETKQALPRNSNFLLKLPAKSCIP